MSSSILAIFTRQYRITLPRQIRLSTTISARMASNQAFSIKAGEDEVRSGRLTERHLELAVHHILQDGLVVVENAVEHSVLDKLNQKMVEDALYLRSLGDKGPFNYNQGNLQQDAPPVREYFDPSIFLSKSFDEALLTVLTSARSFGESYHINSLRTTSKDDVLQWEHGDATKRRHQATAAAGALGR
jgi:hypothetical protein